MLFDHHKSVNQFSIDFIMQIAKELVKNGIEGEHIGIITPYNSQANLIRHAACITSLEIHTIDKYQVRLKQICRIMFKQLGLHYKKLVLLSKRIVFSISLTCNA